MQRQLRLGDILDDYCPRERRVTNHAIVAMLGVDVKQTRCTTCDAEHEYRQAKVPRQRRKTETPAALYAAVLAGGPKRVMHGEDPIKDAVEVQPPAAVDDTEKTVIEGEVVVEPSNGNDAQLTVETAPDADEPDDEIGNRNVEENGPVHRPLIRASLPRPEGTPPPQRPAPDFTIRQPGGRPANRFRPRHQRGGQAFQSQGGRGNGNGNGNMGGPSRGGSGMPRHGGGGRPPQGGAPTRLARRDGPGRKRSK